MRHDSAISSCSDWKKLELFIRTVECPGGAGWGSRDGYGFRHMGSPLLSWTSDGHLAMAQRRGTEVQADALSQLS